MQPSLLDPTDAWPPTRAEALRRLTAFVPRASRVYASERNYDRGPDDRANVSVLSPYVRHRAIGEAEILDAVLARHALSSAEKFVHEVFWRTYWKGWLESHPAAWTRYTTTLAARYDELAASRDRQSAYERAVSGATGIDAFDAWVAELRSEHYVHNHARMWFASIWIFTLKLPWELGADFFMQQLYDGDPASNTLSWRWVAGLHTRGKTYAATRDNIRRYTDNRFALTTPLASAVEALDDPQIPATRPPVLPSLRSGGAPALLVLHEDDLHGDLVALPDVPVAGVCALRTAHARSPRGADPAVVAFVDALSTEAGARAATHYGARDYGLIAATDDAGIAAALGHAASDCGAQRLIAPFATIGPARDRLDALARCGRDLVEFGRAYDAAAWPAATRGFFNLRSRIPAILDELGIGSG